VVGLTAKTTMVERMTDVNGAAADTQNNLGIWALWVKQRTVKFYLPWKI